jgi:O-acetylserine/cysteine efflux transporter
LSFNPKYFSRSHSLFSFWEIACIVGTSWGARRALLGIALLAVYGFDGETKTTMVGFGLVIASALVWGIGNLIAKRAAGANMFALVVWSSVVPPLPFALLSLIFEGGSTSVRALASASWVTWASIAYLSFGAMLFGFARWNILLQHYPTALVAPFALLVPVVGLASGTIVLGERLAVIQFVGVMLVLMGLTVNVYGARWFRSNERD